jgi:invasion protein IalB
MKVKNIFISAIFSVFAVSNAIAESPDQKTTSQRFKDWESICVERVETQQCRATQTLVNNQGQTVSVLNWYQPNSDNTVFELAVPLMIDLNRGVSLSFDTGTTEKRALSFCNNVACFVLSQNDTQLLSSFKKGSVGQITFKPFNQPETSLRFSLQGFSAAFESLK